MTHERVETAIQEFQVGGFVIIVDDADRENEGDLALPADAATPEAIAFMADEARGLICVPMAGADLDRLGLPLMVPTGQNSTRHGTAFTVSTEAAAGVTTGISAADRARTIEVLMDPGSVPTDLHRPGHIFPLRYEPGGVLVRPGHTEASIDLARLAGRRPASVICEIMSADGTMARGPALERFSRVHGIPIVSISELVEYRKRKPGLDGEDAPRQANVHRVAEMPLPTVSGDFRLFAYVSSAGSRGDEPHLALVHGHPASRESVLVRVHSECLTGDVFKSARCDCGEQLDEAVEQIRAEGDGVVIYLRQEGRGIGLVNKLRTYVLQDRGLDTVEANERLGLPVDARHYGAAADILADLGIDRIRLMTNNPAKVESLDAAGVDVVERVPLSMAPRPTNMRYLDAKRRKLGHVFEAALTTKETG